MLFLSASLFAFHPDIRYIQIMPDIFKFESPDLISFQRWQRRAPREFSRAAANVVNTTAFNHRRKAISNISDRVTVRSKPFISRSMRVTKSPTNVPLNKIIAESGSIDISREGRSDGFESLETGMKSRSKRVPTIASRGSTERRKVAGPVRMNKLNRAFNIRQVRGRSVKTRRQRAAALMRVVRSGAIGRQPFIIPSGLTGRMAGMKPGIWKMGNRKRVSLMNPFDGKRGRTKRIAWNSRAADQVTQPDVMMRVWRKEVDFVLSRRR
jgi:hypothetical protein